MIVESGHGSIWETISTLIFVLVPVSNGFPIRTDEVLYNLLNDMDTVNRNIPLQIEKRDSSEKIFYCGKILEETNGGNYFQLAQAYAV